MSRAAFADASCNALTVFHVVRIIGDDNALSIKVGADAGDASTEDIILVRGIAEDVDRAVKRIQQIVEDAKNEESTLR